MKTEMERALEIVGVLERTNAPRELAAYILTLAMQLDKLNGYQRGDATLH
jgi:hypothetical protein